MKLDNNKYMNNYNDSIHEDPIAYFIMSPIEEELISVPGIDDDSIKVFKENNINNTYQLIGLFLSFKGENQKTNDEITKYLEKIGIEENIKLITNTVLQKIDTLMPGFCDISELNFM